MGKTTKILIIGNGFGGIYTLRNLHRLFHHDKTIELSLIGEKNYFLFTPLLHEVATGGINPSNIIEPIRKVLGCCMDKFYLGKTEMINFTDRTVKVGGTSIPYDFLVLAPGGKTNFYNIPGAEKFSFSLKSIEDAIKIKNHIIVQMERASRVEDKTERRKMLKFVVVGGGPTGVELAAELEEFVKESLSQYYKRGLASEASIVLIQKGGELVPQFGEKTRRKSLQTLTRKGVEIILESEVMEVSDSFIILKGNNKTYTETVIWTAGIKPSELESSEEILKSPDGRMVVNEYLQLVDHKEVFAIGDAAFFAQKDKNNIDFPLPALAQVAEKQSLAVAKNIKLLMKNELLKKFHYRSLGNLLSLGQWMAVGEINKFTFSGKIVWWIWRTVYLSKLISFRKKVRVAVDWTMNLFSPRDISQI